MEPMSVGELYYANATGIATVGLNNVGGVSITGTVPSTLETTSNSMSSPYFDQPVTGRLRFIGTGTHKFHCAYSLSASVPTSNQNLSFWLNQDGVTLPKSVYYFTNASGGNNFTVAAHVVVQMTPNSYIELYAFNATGSSQLTLKNVNLVAIGDGNM